MHGPSAGETSISYALVSHVHGSYWRSFVGGGDGGEGGGGGGGGGGREGGGEGGREGGEGGGGEGGGGQLVTSGCDPG